MTPAFVFGVINPIALAGWLILAAGILLRRPFLRDALAGRWFPLGFAAFYSALIALFLARADGGFDTLANVQALFGSPWVALAGWVHYLAFDLFVGAWISRQVMETGLPRWTLIGLLPMTFLFGPAGYLGFEGVKLAFGTTEVRP